MPRSLKNLYCLSHPPPRKEALLGSLSPVAHFSSPLKQKSAIAFNAFPPHPLSTQYSCQDPP